MTIAPVQEEDAIGRKSDLSETSVPHTQQYWEN